MRVGQVLDHVEQHDHVERPAAGAVDGFGGAGLDREPLAPAVGRRIGGEFYAGDGEIALGLLEKEAVGAADLEKLAGAAVAANEADGAGELAPQDRLGAEIIGVAVRAIAGEIALRVISRRVERRRLRAAEPTGRALENVAAVLGIE